MALAWLQPLDVTGDRLRFAIDTGTSPYFELCVGRMRSTQEGIDRVEGVYLTTPVSRNPDGGSPLPATHEITLPAARLQPGDSYVQLVSYKAPDRRGAAFSDVVMIPRTPDLRGRLAPPPVARSMSDGSAESDDFQPARKLACPRSPDTLAQAASIDDVLSTIVSVASPVVLKLLGSAAAGSGTPADDKSSVAGVLSYLLRTLLSGVRVDAAPAAAPATTKSLSLIAGLDDNRFAAAKRTEWSRPFIFGIDDALLGTLAGPVLNVLPQLVNAANQQRLQTQQADNKLITDALTQINQRMLMEQLLAAQKASNDQAAQLAALQAQLQALADAPAQSKPQSLSMNAPAAAPAPRATPSANANLAFVAGDPLPFNGTPRLIFARGRGLTLKLRLAASGQASLLPRAILSITFKGHHDPAKWTKIEQRLTNVAPDTEQSVSVSDADVARLPPNRPIPVIAELRWRTAGGVEAATGATDIVLVDKYFVCERGGPTGEERELTNMGRYRPFWNKVWEAPSLDAVSRSDGRKKSLWELDVTARYVVLLSSDHQANGLMETRLNLAPSDPDSMRLVNGGKLKGGIELSMDEVNKLSTLFGAQALDPERLAGLSAHALAHAGSGEFIARVKLKGRAEERGMVWVVPVFRLAEFTLGAVGKTDEAGQVVAATKETVRFPVPVAARVLGLRSTTGAPASEDAADQPYTFDGFVIDTSQKIALTPITDRRRPRNGAGRKAA